MIRKQKVEPFVKEVLESDAVIGFTDLYLKDETFEARGRVCKRTAVTEVDCRDNFKNYTVNDFTIENLQAAGALDSLRTAQYYDGDIDKVLDVVDGICNNDNKNIK